MIHSKFWYHHINGNVKKNALKVIKFYYSCLPRTEQSGSPCTSHKGTKCVIQNTVIILCIVLHIYECRNCLLSLIDLNGSIWSELFVCVCGWKLLIYSLSISWMRKIQNNQKKKRCITKCKMTLDINKQWVLHRKSFSKGMPCICFGL